jgi:hypothetical protein
MTDYAELVKRVRDILSNSIAGPDWRSGRPFFGGTTERRVIELLPQLADAIEALAARIAELALANDDLLTKAMGIEADKWLAEDRAEKAEAARDEAVNALGDIESARTKHAASGFPIGLYPDPATWMEERARVVIDVKPASRDGDTP